MRKRTIEEFIAEARLVHGDRFDYSESIYIGAKKPIRIRCVRHDTWITGRATPDTHLLSPHGLCALCKRESLSRRDQDLGASSFAFLHPSLASQANGWDPKCVFAKSHVKLPWRCPVIGHIWIASPAQRDRRPESDCPYCSGRKVLPGFNDLATRYPEIAAEASGWDPSTVHPGSEEKRQWACSHGHAPWKQSPYHRTRAQSANRGCPTCTGHIVLAGFNDLATTDRALAQEAYGDWDPRCFTRKSEEKVEWWCSNGHSFTQKIRSRAIGGQGCPHCVHNRRVLKGFNDLATLFPVIAAEAHGWDPTAITPGHDKKKLWKCSDPSHPPYVAFPYSRTGPPKAGCPYCSGYSALPGVTDLLTVDPRLATEAFGWDPKLVSSESEEALPWKCSQCGCVWEQSAKRRTNKRSESNCPACSESTFRQNSPGWIYLAQTDDAQRFGITNTPEIRLAYLQRSGWRLIENELRGPMKGDSLLGLAHRVKQWLSAHSLTEDQGSEQWKKSAFVVRTLEELFRSAMLQKASYGPLLNQNQPVDP